MKKSIALAGIIGLCLLLSVSVEAQNPASKGKDNPKNKTEKQIKTKRQNKDQDSVAYKSREGNAYGRHKYGLEGKAYGQERSRQAQLNKDQKEKELDGSIIKAEDRIKGSKEKIRAAQEQLEQDKKAGKISDKDYKNRRDRLEATEKQVDSLQKTINRGKAVRKSTKKDQ